MLLARWMIAVFVVADVVFASEGSRWWSGWCSASAAAAEPSHGRRFRSLSPRTGCYASKLRRSQRNLPGFPVSHRSGHRAGHRHPHHGDLPDHTGYSGALHSYTLNTFPSYSTTKWTLNGLEGDFCVNTVSQDLCTCMSFFTKVFPQRLKNTADCSIEDALSVGTNLTVHLCTKSSSLKTRGFLPVFGHGLNFPDRFIGLEL